MGNANIQINQSIVQQGANHLVNFIDTKGKCRNLKNWPVKRLCGRCLVFRLKIQSCWYFRPSFVNCCSSNHLFGSVLSPFPVWNSMSIQVYTTVWKGEGVRTHSRGGDLRQINTCCRVPLQVNFTTFCFGVYIQELKGRGHLRSATISGDTDSCSAAFSAPDRRQSSERYTLL